MIASRRSARKTRSRRRTYVPLKGLDAGTTRIILSSGQDRPVEIAVSPADSDAERPSVPRVKLDRKLYNQSVHARDGIVDVQKSV